MRERRTHAVLVALGVVLVVTLAAWLAPRTVLTSYRSGGAERARLTGGDPERGRRIMRLYGCSSCHTISGVPGADATIGPPLDDLAYRGVLAGRLPNTAENLERWIRHPQSIEPGNVMPEMGVTERDARDIAAYLYAQD